MSILPEARLLIAGSAAGAVAGALLPWTASRCLTGDLREPARLRRALRGVSYVIHAPAPEETIHLGAVENLIDASLDCHVKRLVAISPAGVSGRALESRFIAANAFSGETGTRLAVVRHGQLLEPLLAVLRQQAEAGQFSLPDPRLTRFLLTAADRAALVWRALTEMRGGEVFVPRLPAVELRELARAVAPQCPRRTTHRDAALLGSTLHECLIAADEAPRTVADGDCYLILPRLRPGSGHVPPGEPCEPGFRYASDTCPHRLSDPELREWIDRLSPGPLCQQPPAELLRPAV